MKPKVLVVNAIKREADDIGDIILPAGYTPWIVDTIEGVEPALSAGDCLAVLLDLDSLEVSNRTVRQMTLKFPQDTSTWPRSRRSIPSSRTSGCHLLSHLRLYPETLGPG